MRIIVLLLLSGFSLFQMPASAQKSKKKEVQEVVVKNKTGQYTYEGIIEVAGVDKNELFRRVNQWAVTNLKTADNNIQSDEENHMVTNTTTLIMDPKATFLFNISSGFINFKLNIQSRDGRCRFVFDQIVTYFVLGNNNASGQTLSYEKVVETGGPIYKHVIREVNEKLYNVAQHLEYAVKTGNVTPVSTEEEW